MASCVLVRDVEDLSSRGSRERQPRAEGLNTVGVSEGFPLQWLRNHLISGNFPPILEFSESHEKNLAHWEPPWCSPRPPTGVD